MLLVHPRSVPYAESCRCQLWPYQMVMLGHVAVQDAHGDQRDGQRWGQRPGQQRGSRGSGAGDDRSRSNRSSRRRPRNHRSLRRRGTVWQGRVNNRTRRWHKGRRVLGNTSFFILFTIFFCSSIFTKKKRKKKVILNQFPVKDILQMDILNFI